VFQFNVKHRFLIRSVLFYFELNLNLFQVQVVLNDIYLGVGVKQMKISSLDKFTILSIILCLVYKIITESSTGEATFIEIKFAAIISGYDVLPYIY